MQLWTFAALLILQCWAPLVSLQSADTDKLTSVGTVDISGSSVRVYELGGANIQVAEPKISFLSTCDNLRYHHLYQKYQLTFPIQISFPELRSSSANSKSVGQVSLTGLKVTADEVLANRDSGVTVLAQLKSPGEARLIFMCDTFIRCQTVKDFISSNPDEVRLAVDFVPSGLVGSKFVSFGAIRSSNSPSFNCDPARWVVFQKRVDGSLSFAQNWDTYVKGFGNPNSNYWMGLDQLFAMTVTNTNNTYPEATRCRLRIEIEDFNGTSYWGEYAFFEVLGPQQNYRLRVGQAVEGSAFSYAEFNEQQFSTYDRDNDKVDGNSCSQSYGFGGWWYNGCHSINLNGAYGNANITNNPAYSSAYKTGANFKVGRSTLMKFKCN